MTHIKGKQSTREALLLFTVAFIVALLSAAEGQTAHQAEVAREISRIQRPAPLHVKSEATSAPLFRPCRRQRIDKAEHPFRGESDRSYWPTSPPRKVRGSTRPTPSRSTRSIRSFS
jgi:hypothetical protein